MEKRLKRAIVVLLAAGGFGFIVVNSISEPPTAGGPGQSTDKTIIAEPAPKPESEGDDHSPSRVRMTQPTSGAETTLDVEFPSGEVLTVKLKQWREEIPPFPPAKRLIDMYDQLVAAADAGNIPAARELYRALDRCSRAYPDRHSLEAAIDRLHRTGEIVYPDRTGSPTASEHVPAGVDTSEFEQSMRERSASCEGITDEHIAAARDYLDIAAQAGDYPAVNALIREVGTGTREACELLHRNWENGHLSNAESIGICYRKGIPEETGGEPDYVRAYAWTLAYYQVREAALLQNRRHNASQLIAGMHDVLYGLGGYLTPQQQAEAERLAVDLIRNNPNCCLGRW